MVEKPHRESRSTFFLHPLSGEPIEIAETATPIERLRLLCNPELLPDFSRGMFEALFPLDMELRPDFNIHSTEPNEEARLTMNEKAIRRALLTDVFGYTTPRRATWQDTSFLPHLHVAFTKDPYAFVNALNTLPAIQRLKDIWQTSLDDRGSRWNHTQHLMHWGALDVLRYGLHQPEVFLKKYEQDMQEYAWQYQAATGKTIVFSLDPTEEERVAMTKVFTDNSEKVDTEVGKQKVRAACVAVSYAKYLLVSMAFHDAETPGWCDIFMKATGSGVLQGQDTFSEDDALVRNFDRIFTHDRDLARFVAKEHLDVQLLTTLVKSVASENDTCLPGLMYKDKRKGSTRGASWDLDQSSGTLTNMEIMAETYLPGGFNPHITNGNEPPLFSFEARMMVLYYSMLSRLPKEKLEKSLKTLGIDPARMYIAAEEITYGQSVMLEKVSWEEKTEIVPVPMVPGDVKRGYLAFIMLYTGFYLHPNKETVIALLKNMVTEWLANRPERSYDFLYRGICETNRLLDEVNPVMTFFERFDQHQAEMLSDREIRALANQDPDGFFLIKKIRMASPYPEKPGTLVCTEDRKTDFALRVLVKHRGQPDGENPYSLPVRAKVLRERYTGQDVYMVIRLSEDDVRCLSSDMERMPADDRARMARVFAKWTDTPVDGMDFSKVRKALAEPFLL